MFAQMTQIKQAQYFTEIVAVSVNKYKAHTNTQSPRADKGCAIAFTCVVWPAIGQSEGVRMAPCLFVLLKPVDQQRSKCILTQIHTLTWSRSLTKTHYFCLTAEWQSVIAMVTAAPQALTTGLRVWQTSTVVYQPEHVEDYDDENDDQQGGQGHHHGYDRHVPSIFVTYTRHKGKGQNNR